MSTDEFFEAARAGDVETLRRLVSANPALITTTRAAGETPLMTALYNKQQKAADWLVQSGAPLDIFAAAAVGDIATIERLLQPPAAGLNAYSYDGWTPLHLAAFFGQRAAVERLMAAGADIERRLAQCAAEYAPARRGRRRARRGVAAAHQRGRRRERCRRRRSYRRSTLPPKRVTFPSRGHCSSAAPTRTPSMPRTARRYRVPRRRGTPILSIS